MGSTYGGQFAQNVQKLDENYKINIFGTNQWGRTWRELIFQSVESPSPLDETLPWYFFDKMIIGQQHMQATDLFW